MDNTKTAIKYYRLIWTFVALFVVAGTSVGVLTIKHQKKLFKAETQRQKMTIEEQSTMLESLKNSNMGVLINNVLGHVDNDIKNNPNGSLNVTTIERIAALSYSLKPYKYFEGDSLAENELSPERGQLLLSLSIMNIDSCSFDTIMLTTSFSRADLRGADLKRADLRGVDLKGADLRNADLSGANLIGADLSGANLWGANLNMANLSHANLKRADLSWADLNGADLRMANLNGANLTSAQLRSADLRQASLQWAELSGALFNDANLEGGDVFGASLTKASLTNANLTDVLMRSAIFSEAIMTGTELTNAEVEYAWFDKLNEWKTLGVKQIQVMYLAIETSTSTKESRKFRLEKIKN